MPAALPGVLARSTIVLFGDSLTQRGFEPEGWAAALAHYYGRRADVYNRGYGGYNTRWARELAPALFARPPQGQAHLLATVWFGANDACISTERAHVPLLEFEANLETIVQQARQVARVVVVMTPPPLHGPSGSVPPSASQYCPGGQDAQSASAARPTPSPIVPGGHRNSVP